MTPIERGRDVNKPTVYATPNRPTPGRPIVFTADACNGCNFCVDVCPEDIFIPSPEKGGVPIIVYPEECWYCGACVDDCNHAGAIRLSHPLQQRARWKRKNTNEHFRVG